MLQNAFLEAVAWKDKWHLIDEDNVVPVDDQVVDGIASDDAWRLHVSWVLPGAVEEHWVAGSDLKAALEVADLLATTRDVELE